MMMISLAGFQKACANNCVQVVEQVLEVNPRLAYQHNIEFHDGENALHIACCAGAYEVCKLMLDHLSMSTRSGKKSYFTNLQARGGHSLLYYACLHDHLAIVKLLVEMGADINNSLPSDYHAPTALHIAISKKNLEICLYLIPLVFEPSIKLVVIYALSQWFVPLIRWLWIHWNHCFEIVCSEELGKLFLRAIYGEKYDVIQMFMTTILTEDECQEHVATALQSPNVTIINAELQRYLLRWFCTKTNQVYFDWIQNAAQGGRCISIYQELGYCSRPLELNHNPPLAEVTLR